MQTALFQERKIYMRTINQVPSETRLPCRSVRPLVCAASALVAMLLGGTASPAWAAPHGGFLVGWGDNSFGQTNVPAGNDFVAIAGGLYHSLALFGVALASLLRQRAMR